MKLNIGAGYKRFPEFLNVDHDPLTNPDYLVDLEDLHLPIDDNTVEYIIAHHVFEHIGAGFFDMMKEIYRICKNDAVLEIKVPHHRSDVQHMDPTHVRTITVDTMLLFSKEYNQWHIDTYNSSSGFGLKLDVDFVMEKFKLNPHPKWAERFKNMTDAEIEEVSANFNNVYVEVEMIMRVKK